jgi:hypothetical protein
VLAGLVSAILDDSDLRSRLSRLMMPGAESEMGEERDEGKRRLGCTLGGPADIPAAISIMGSEGSVERAREERETRERERERCGREMPGEGGDGRET